MASFGMHGGINTGKEMISHGTSNRIAGRIEEASDKTRMIHVTKKGRFMPEPTMSILSAYIFRPASKCLGEQ